MPKYYKILDNGVSPMASKKSGNPRGYNKTGGKKNDPNRAKFVEKYIKQNTKSADRPATKAQARNAYYLTSVDDKNRARFAKKTLGSLSGKKTPSGSMMRTRADGNKPGGSTRAMTGSTVSKKSGNPKGYNKTGGKKNDPNRAKFVEKYLKQNTKSADRPATKKQARNAYYLTSVDDKNRARFAKSKTTPAGSMKQASPKKPSAKQKLDSMAKAVRTARAKEKARLMMRPAPKATGARDRNRRTY